MIKIDHTLLSAEALDNLLVEIITRQATDYGEHETAIQAKKNQLTRKLQTGDAVIVYSQEDEVCDIIRCDDFNVFKNNMADSE